MATDRCPECGAFTQHISGAPLCVRCAEYHRRGRHIRLLQKHLLKCGSKVGDIFDGAPKVTEAAVEMQASEYRFYNIQPRYNGTCSRECEQWRQDEDGFITCAHPDKRLGGIVCPIAHRRLRKLICEVASSGVEFADERVNYVSVQIDAVTWREIREATDD